jgi:putative transposase
VASDLLFHTIVRKAIRLQNFDYSSNGAYFITICTHHRRHLLAGSGLEIAQRELSALADRFPGLALDVHRFMPDHLHAILQLNGCRATLSQIVQAYKSLTTRENKAARPLRACVAAGLLRSGSAVRHRAGGIT